MKYRAEIDGLRAIAVTPVILYHAGIPFFKGGFLGVDIFFVISGYLITTIIISELENTGRFNLWRFYERRARRILPALGMTVLMTLLISPFALIPSQIKDVGQSVVAIALFLSNYFFYLEIDYFNPFASRAPLLHTWSLAVEEQFYVIFPLLLMLSFKLRISRVLIILAIISISFLLSVWTTSHDPLLSFYSIHTRAWELAIGSLVAIGLRRDWLAGSFREKWGPALALTGLIATLASFFVISSASYHPGFITLLPVLGTAILIWFMRPGTFVYGLLSNKAFVHIGLMSYGLYLYHNPLFSYIDTYFDSLGEQTTLVKLTIIPIVYVISFASLKFVEQPVRKPSSTSSFKVLSYSVVGLLVFFLVGLSIHLTKGFRYQIGSFYEARGVPLLVDVDKERAAIDLASKKFAPSNRDFDCTSETCKKVLLIGDSLSHDSYLALSTHSGPDSYRRVYFDDTCMHLATSVSTLEGIKECRGRDMDFRDLLRQADQFIVTAKWQDDTYVHGYELARMLRTETGKDVLVVGSAMFTDLATFSIKAWRSGIERSEFSRVLYEYQRWDRIPATQSLQVLVDADPDIDWISRQDFFCNNGAKTCDLFTESGDPLIWDPAHITSHAFARFSDFLKAGY